MKRYEKIIDKYGRQTQQTDIRRFFSCDESLKRDHFKHTKTKEVIERVGHLFSLTERAIKYSLEHKNPLVHSLCEQNLLNRPRDTLIFKNERTTYFVIDGGKRNDLNFSFPLFFSLAYLSLSLFKLQGCKYI